ncbi:hypothetical protein HMPREF1326_01221 [Akkermansia sp. KLE1605]|nr:hypothetical protein HMPREF1326_01221 [Akkermansia sp. KLE1605]
MGGGSGRKNSFFILFHASGRRAAGSFSFPLFSPWRPGSGDNAEI